MNNTSTNLLQIKNSVDDNRMDVDVHDNADINSTENNNNNTGNEETSSDDQDKKKDDTNIMNSDNEVEKSISTDEGKKNEDETPTVQCEEAENGQETKDNKKIRLVETGIPDGENSKGTNYVDISLIQNDSKDNNGTAAKHGETNDNEENGSDDLYEDDQSTKNDGNYTPELNEGEETIDDNLDNNPTIR